MGLGYLFLLCMIFGAAALAVFLLRAAWKMFRRRSKKALALLPLAPALLCAAYALWLLAAVLREPPWGFHF